jgi:hypothetical protein
LVVDDHELLPPGGGRLPRIKFKIKRSWGMFLEVSPGFGRGDRALIFLILLVKQLAIERVFE